MKVSYDYIVAILASDIVINCVSKSKGKLLKEIGARRKLFVRSKWYLDYEVDNKKQLALKLEQLRDWGFCFAGAAGGWPPSAVFDLLRAEGYVSGKIIEIMWRNPEEVLKSEV